MDAAWNGLCSTPPISDQLFTGTKRNYADLSLSSTYTAHLVIRLGDRVGSLFEILPCYLGQQFERQYGVKSLRLKAICWLSDLSTLFSFFIGAIIRCTAGLVAGFIDLAAHPFRRAMFAIASAIISMAVLPFTLLLALVQRLLLLQGPLSRLSAAENQTATGIFGNRKWLAEVRLIRFRFGIFGSIQSSFVLGNLVVLKSSNRDILVHELVHVWQYRFLGAKYAGNALLAHWKYGRNKGSGDAYDWRRIAVETGSRWLDLNAEAGAQLIEDTYETAGTGWSAAPHVAIIKDAYARVFRTGYPEAALQQLPAD